MITKVTKENQGLYKALFEAASTVLSTATNPVTVDSLDKFFANYNTLSSQTDNIYKYLPLDEDTFDIDADTRTINVPDSFRKNGISVQGDQGAEVVFFTVDRYFDTVDLYGTTPIIQWEITSNKTTTTGISPVIYKDVSVMADKGKMIFGWVINNTISGAAGTVKFSVRFYRVQGEGTEKKLLFSLSTLTASVVINPGLDFTYNGETAMNFDSNVVTDDLAMISARNAWENSSPYLVQTSVNPEWQKVILESTLAKTTVTEDGVQYLIIDLGTNNNEDGKYTLAVRAFASDAGQISYIWYKKNINGGDWTSLGSGTEGYEQVASNATMSTSQSYYTKVGDAYTPYTQAYAEGDSFPTGTTFYQKINTYTATGTGNYKVIAKNNKGVIPGTVESAIVRIPAPGALTTTYNEGVSDKTLLTVTGTSTAAKGNVTLGVTATTAQITGLTPTDGLTYSWKKGTETISGATAATYDIPEVSSEATLKTYDETFSVSVVADRNGDSTAAVTKSFRVTAPAYAFTGLNINVTSKSIKSGKTVELKPEFGTQLDSMACDSIKWSLMKVTNDDADENDRTNDTEVKTDTVEKANVANIKYSVATTGTYYFKLINVVNGNESAEAYSPNSVIVVE